MESNLFREMLPSGENIRLKIVSDIYYLDEGMILPDCMDIPFDDESETEDSVSNFSDAESYDPHEICEQVMLAEYRDEDGRVTITYDDSAMTDSEETVTQVTFTKDKPCLVSILRDGANRSMLVFEEGKRHVCEYIVYGMSIPVCVGTRRLTNTVTDGVGNISLDYVLDINGNSTQRAKITLTLEKIEKNNL